MIRVVKYFIYLMILYSAILSIADMAGYLNESGGSIYDLLNSERGMLAMAAMAALSLLYPSFGYVTYKSKASFKEDKESIIKAFKVNGMVLKSEDSESMTFGAANFLRRLRLLFEDEVAVRPTQEGVTISGNRRTVAYVKYRLEAYTNKR